MHVFPLTAVDIDLALYAMMMIYIANMCPFFPGLFFTTNLELLFQS